MSDIKSRHFAVDVALMLTSSSGAVFVTIIAIGCILGSNGIEQKFRGLLLSFSVANLVGASMLAYDSTVLISHGVHWEYLSVSVTMMLSLSHLLLLLTSEYVDLTCSGKQHLGDFAGLLMLCWIISMTCGGLNVVNICSGTRTAFLLVCVATAVYILRFYFLVVATRRAKHNMIEKYRKNFLSYYRRGMGRDIHEVDREWKMKLLRLMIISYLSCSLPWTANELREVFGLSWEEGFSHGSSEREALMENVALIVYSVNFYFPSAVCVYLQYAQCTSRAKSPNWKRISTYSFRDTLN